MRILLRQKPYLEKRTYKLVLQEQLLESSTHHRAAAIQYWHSGSVFLFFSIWPCSAWQQTIFELPILTAQDKYHRFLVDIFKAGEKLIARQNDFRLEAILFFHYCFNFWNSTWQCSIHFTHTNDDISWQCNGQRGYIVRHEYWRLYIPFQIFKLVSSSTCITPHL